LTVFDRAYRLGPLSIEQKRRVPVKRQKQEKVQEEERRPQEIKEEDIKRSDNETSKNVLIVRKLLLEPWTQIYILKILYKDQRHPRIYGSYQPF